MPTPIALKASLARGAICSRALVPSNAGKSAEQQPGFLSSGAALHRVRSPEGCSAADTVASVARRSWLCVRCTSYRARQDMSEASEQSAPAQAPNCLTRRAAFGASAAALMWPAVSGAAFTAPVVQEPPQFGARELMRGLGIGDSDIYYPELFEGTWECFSTLVSVETPQGEDMSDGRSVDFARRQLGYTVSYKARFMPHKGRVIGDRLFTTKSLVESTVGPDVIEGGEWNPNKPNLLVLKLQGGMQVENLVTKRSFDVTGPGRFDTSEYSKQVFDNSRQIDGPPAVKASRNVTRYKWDPTTSPVSEIEAFQRVAMFPVVGGRAGNRAGGLTIFDVLSLNMGDKPTTIYKYLVRFKRVQPSAVGGMVGEAVLDNPLRNFHLGMF